MENETVFNRRNFSELHSLQTKAIYFIFYACVGITSYRVGFDSRTGYSIANQTLYFLPAFGCVSLSFLWNDANHRHAVFADSCAVKQTNHISLQQNISKINASIC